MVKTAKKESPSKPPVSAGVHSVYLIRPRVTEKASERAMNANVYIFDIGKSTTKGDVKRAVVEAYNVHPVKIAVSPVRGKSVMHRGKMGKTAHGKKAFVYLKKGDKIEFV